MTMNSKISISFSRWLSLGLALQRLLENWQPLTEFFKSEASTTKPAKVSKKSEVSPSASTRNPKKKLKTSDERKVKANTTPETPTLITSTPQVQTAKLSIKVAPQQRQILNLVHLADNLILADICSVSKN